VRDSADVLVDRKPVGDLRRIEGRLVVCVDRSSDRNTRTSPRTYPWCPSRASPGHHTSGKSYSQTPALLRAVIHLLRSASHFSGSITGRSLSGPPRSHLSRNTPQGSEFPNTVAVKCPVLQPENCLGASESFLLRERHHLRDRRLTLHPAVRPRIHADAIIGERPLRQLLGPSEQPPLIFSPRRLSTLNFELLFPPRPRAPATHICDKTPSPADRAPEQP